MRLYLDYVIFFSDPSCYLFVCLCNIYKTTDAIMFKQDKD